MHTSVVMSFNLSKAGSLLFWLLINTECITNSHPISAGYLLNVIDVKNIVEYKVLDFYCLDEIWPHRYFLVLKYATFNLFTTSIHGPMLMDLV